MQRVSELNQGRSQHCLVTVAQVLGPGGRQIRIISKVENQEGIQVTTADCG